MSSTRLDLDGSYFALAFADWERVDRELAEEYNQKPPMAPRSYLFLTRDNRIGFYACSAEDLSKHPRHKETDDIVKKALTHYYKNHPEARRVKWKDIIYSKETTAHEILRNHITENNSFRFSQLREEVLRAVAPDLLRD